MAAAVAAAAGSHKNFPSEIALEEAAAAVVVVSGAALALDRLLAALVVVAAADNDEDGDMVWSVVVPRVEAVLPLLLPVASCPRRSKRILLVVVRADRCCSPPATPSKCRLPKNTPGDFGFANVVVVVAAVVVDDDGAVAVVRLLLVLFPSVVVVPVPVVAVMADNCRWCFFRR